MADAPNLSSTPPRPSSQGEASLALDARDWYRATWRDLAPLPPAPGSAAPLTPTDLRARFQLGLEVDHFRREVVPSLTAAERAVWLAAVRERLQGRVWPGGNPWSPAAPEYAIAAALGAHAELDALVASWPDDAFVQSVQAELGDPQDVVLGQSSATLVETHMRRLKLPLRTSDQVRAWLAHTELRALDFIGWSVLREKYKVTQGQLIRTFGLARCEETARWMAELAVSSRDPKTPREWLERWPMYSVGPLSELARGRGKVATLAAEVLRAVARGKHAALVVGVLPAAPSVGPDVPVLTSADAPTWLTPVAMPKAEAWPPFEELPPILLGAARLGSEHVQVVLAAMRASTFAQPHPTAIALNGAAEPASLDRFVCRLLELWQGEGLPNKHTWVAVAAGLCGRERAAMVLGRAARPWRQEKRHLAANLAIEALAVLGNDVALGELRKFSQINRDWTLVEVAAGHLARVAVERGLSADDLEDRTVPDCGLDARGSTVFDFGRRRFELALGSDLRPRIHDGARLRPELPAPNAGDDPVRAQAAVEAWKLLKKTLPAVLRTSVARLEAALCDGRRWRVADFEQVLVRHPVVGHLVRGLLWSVPSRARCFRVAEDLSWAGEEDETLALGPDEHVELAHPVLLSTERLVEWSRRFGEYELVQPFPQLGRAVSAPEAGELNTQSLGRFGGIPCLAIALADGLEKRGWRREDVGDGGCFASHSRTLRGVTAVVGYEPGIFIGSVRDSPEQTIESCRFFAQADFARPLRLRDVHPVAFSEVAQDLARLTAR